MLFILVMAKLKKKCQHYFSVSHDPSEIIHYYANLAQKEHFLLSMLKTIVLLNIFHGIFSGFFDEQKVKKIIYFSYRI